MNIAILSRNPSLYSTASLVRAGRRKQHYVRVLDHMQCDISIETGKPQVFYQGQLIKNIDIIIPRIGSSATSYGASVIRQFESMGVTSTLSAEPLLRARDKLSCLQLLAAEGLGVPKSLVSNNYFSINEMLDRIGDLPAIIKLINGTHGLGVILAESKSNAESIMEAFYKAKQKIMLQEYIEEAKGADIRVFIVGDEIVGVMKRQAKEGEFRSNLHRGASSSVVSLSGLEAEIALKATKILGLNIAGVDMLQSERGPLILEVNASPGLEGIETTTGNDIAGKIIDFATKQKNNPWK